MLFFSYSINQNGGRMFKLFKISGILPAIIIAITVTAFNFCFTQDLSSGSNISIINAANDLDRISAENNSNSGDVFYNLNFKTLTPVTNFNNSALLSDQFNRAFNTAGAFMLADTLVLPANPGPSNNGGSPNWAIFFDLIALNRQISVTRMSTGSTATAGASFTVEVYTRVGTALGGPVASGPGSSTAGWTLIGTVPVVQGPVGSGVSELFTLPTITVPATDTVGVAIKFLTFGPRYTGTGSGPYNVYQDTNLILITGDGRSAPFTPTGSFFAPRALTGELRYVTGALVAVTGNGTGIPGDFKLGQNYPNPFNPSTTIDFAIPQNSNVSIRIYDVKGQEVDVLANSEYTAGSYSVKWNAGNFSSGVYFYRIQAGSFTETKKLLLVK